MSLILRLLMLAMAGTHHSVIKQMRLCWALAIRLLVIVGTWTRPPENSCSCSLSLLLWGRSEEPLPSLELEETPWIP